MKNAIFVILILAFSFPLFCQRTPPASRYNDYMQRSRRKQTAGIIFLSSGAAMAAGGTILVIDGINRNKNDNGYDEISSGEVEAVLGGLVTLIGVGAMCGSVPFFVGAHRSRKKAMSLSFKTENAPRLHNTSLSAQLYPALACRIPLGR